MRLLKQVEIQPGCLNTDGNRIDSLCGLSLSEIYRKVCNGYPKFFKMDGLCKTGFVAAELLLEGLTPEQKAEGSVILFGRAARWPPTAITRTPSATRRTTTPRPPCSSIRWPTS